MYDIIPSTPPTDVQSVEVSTIEENSPSNKIKPLQWSPERLQYKTKPEVTYISNESLAFGFLQYWL